MSSRVSLRSRASGFFGLDAQRPDGLPSARLLFALPALLLLVGIVLVALGINGSSSGAFWPSLHTDRDPSLIAGQPEAIRSDEWNITTSWTIDQLQQGLPPRNQTFPGGMNAGLPMDLPSTDWSVAFRPQLIGYLVLDADHATAWRWWLSGLALIAAAYAFLITILPRRPIVAAALSIGFFFSPFFQWWYSTITFWPAVWAFVTMAALIWTFRSDRRGVRIVWAAVLAYATAVLAIGIYAPYIIPAVLVVALFGVGLVTQTRRAGMPWNTLLARLLPILGAAIIAGVVAVTYLLTRLKDVEALLNTSYPGQRLTETGQGSILTLGRVLGAAFSQSLKSGGGFLNQNSSEASSFLLLGLFVVPIVIFVVVRNVRSRQPAPWVMIGLSASLVLLLAFMFVPGWSSIAHLLFLDRTTADRCRIGLGIGSFALIGYLIAYVDASKQRLPAWIVAIAVGAFAVAQAGVALLAIRNNGLSTVLRDAPLAALWIVLSAFAIWALSRRGLLLIGAAAFLVISVASSVTVNPVYYGVLDLRETAVSRSIIKVNNAAPGGWVGIGVPLVTAMLLESGVPAYNGTQGAPSATMWKQIDPQRKYVYSWNRLGFVNWSFGTGEPVVTTPAADQIRATFDPCGSFAARHVKYVLTDQTVTDNACLVRVTSNPVVGGNYTIYRVVSP